MTIESVEDGIRRRRYVRGCCSECGATSPVCDQQADARRSMVRTWFKAHDRAYHFGPYIEWRLASWTCEVCGEQIPEDVSHDTSRCGQEGDR